MSETAKGGDPKTQKSVAAASNADSTSAEDSMGKSLEEPKKMGKIKIDIENRLPGIGIKQQIESYSETLNSKLYTPISVAKEKTKVKNLIMKPAKMTPAKVLKRKYEQNIYRLMRKALRRKQV